MNCKKLEQNIIDAIEEQQLKLGYLKETVRLYYPLSSLNRFLETNVSVEEMNRNLERFSKQTKDTLGGISISNKNERFCIAIPPEGTEQIHKNLKEHSFLTELIQVVGKHGCTLEEVLAIFKSHSEQVHVEAVSDGEFDYLVYFEDGLPDAYRYCLSVEGEHVIYHRYTVEDYEEFGF